MKINIKKVILFALMFIFVLAFFETIVLAGDDLNPGDYHHTVQYGDATYIFNKGAQLLKIIRNIAAAVSVSTISIIGIRYMIGSVEQKAEYKQTMYPVVVGCMLIGSLSIVLTLIQSIVA